jgi:molybdenum cofactor synthesis domain-containing protein
MHMDVTVICVGDELLSGDIADMNSVWLARRLNEIGASLTRISVIPDDIDTIAGEVGRCDTDMVIVTGGIGPTHDDLTRFGIAKAAGVGLVRDNDAVSVVERVKSKWPEVYIMADIPEGSEVIPNPVGAAPGFIVDDRIFVFPGVPSEMMAMFELVKDRFKGKKTFVDILYTSRQESSIVSTLNEAVGLFPDVKFGSYPSGILKIKMTSYSIESLIAAKAWLSERIS